MQVDYSAVYFTVAISVETLSIHSVMSRISAVKKQTNKKKKKKKTDERTHRLSLFYERFLMEEPEHGLYFFLDQFDPDT